MIQDDSREIVLARLCRLSRTSSRKGIDATLGDLPFELKSTTTSNVSTARDAGMRHVKKWRSQYWIIGKGPATSLRDAWAPDELYFAHPKDLESFFSSVETKIRRLVGLFEEALELAEGGMEQRKVEEMRKIIDARVGTLNCPSMTMAYVRANCHKVSLSKPADHLRRLVSKHPL